MERLPDTRGHRKAPGRKNAAANGRGNDVHGLRRCVCCQRRSRGERGKRAAPGQHKAPSNCYQDDLEGAPAGSPGMMQSQSHRPSLAQRWTRTKGTTRQSRRKQPKNIKTDCYKSLGESPRWGRGTINRGRQRQYLPGIISVLPGGIG